MRAMNGRAFLWFGLAYAVMETIGPRPAFVKTAYAAEPVATIEAVVMSGIDADTHEMLRTDMILTTERRDACGAVVPEACD